MYLGAWFWLNSLVGCYCCHFAGLFGFGGFGCCFGGFWATALVVFASQTFLVFADFRFLGGVCCFDVVVFADFRFWA